MVSIAERRAHAEFEALLLEPMLEPLQSAFGQYGEFVGQTFAQALGRALGAGRE